MEMETPEKLRNLPPFTPSKLDNNYTTFTSSHQLHSITFQARRRLLLASHVVRPFDKPNTDTYESQWRSNDL
jgi:hypothetical protein